MRNRRWLILALATITLGSQKLHAAETVKLPIAATESSGSTTNELTWQTDYRAAMKDAAAAKQLLFIWFADPAQEGSNEKLAVNIFAAEAMRSQMARLTLLKLPTTTVIKQSDDKEIKLLEHRAFAELHRGPGLAMIDLRDEKQKHFGYVVTIYPFSRGAISVARLKTLCELPAGTLTQRTLMFAVRTHAAAPQSAWSPHSAYLSSEAEKHSVHQASINLQGHHNWEARFHQINSGLGGGSSKEVCAESWPGQTLVAAAEECVHSWSQSSGHWSAVSARHAHFGYDMKRGTNGVWYATGIFGGN